MKKVNSLSSGETSSYLAEKYPADYEVFSLVCIDDVECAPKDKSIAQYVNDKLGEKYISQYGEFVATAEDDKSLYVMRDLEQRIGRNIIWVRGDSYDTIINKRYESLLRGNKQRLPSWARRWCTEEMKMIPIFYWWFYNVGEKVEMRIGFRFDEFGRMENFFNNSDPTNFKIPVSCSTRGQKLQRHETFNWRACKFPLIRDGITKPMIKEHWEKNGWVQDFMEFRKIAFPEISNCVGCFHKKPETLAYQWGVHPSKMKWFAKQEKLGMGTWLDSRTTYEEIGTFAETNPFIAELALLGASCDSGGCTD